MALTRATWHLPHTALTHATWQTDTRSIDSADSEWGVASSSSVRAIANLFLTRILYLCIIMIYF